MRFVEAGGARISAIGVGTWQFGSREWGYGEQYAEVESQRILARAIELGVNLVDTAEMYGFGRSEKLVGRAVGGEREKVFLATKFFPLLPLPGQVLSHARGSARRLGVDAIDLYQLHWPNPLAPLSWPARGLARVLESGLAAHGGVSNYSLEQWQQTERIVGRPVLTNQVQYSLVARRLDRQLVPYAQRNDRVVIAYSPLGQGLLSARYTAADRPVGLARRSRFSAANLARLRPLLDTVRQVASAHGATAAQVALAWVIRHPNVVAIPGASSVQQLEDNVAAADLDLTDAEFVALNEASDRAA